MKKQNARTLALIVGTFTYLLVGAAVFDAMESENETRESIYLNDTLYEIFQRYNVSTEDQDILTRTIILNVPHTAGRQWKFSGAFYFATTVITTIGYGHSCPRTSGGKVFVMVYALLGIPMTLVMFQSIGERLNTLTTHVLRLLKRCCGCRDARVSQTNLIAVGMTLCGLVSLGGAVVFSRYEGWSYLDSIYYSFITLTTIGFGDFVAMQKDDTINLRQDYVAFTLIFILFGLTVVGAAMNLLVLRFLTMNTVDEQREELEAAKAAAVAVKLDGDVITGNGNVIMAQASTANEASDSSALSSVCSCSCYELHRPRHHYTVTRSPSKISHLLPLRLISNSVGPSASLDEQQPAPSNAKRASI